ncbi:unnamed protein product [Bemisia tabaci]|uniref:WD repeat-containing protein 34 n=1 Tax=Bemisia tabaci TaxID=7038 RepID=A0A9P0AJA3_BEMTA|nr:unnamed protein product [Bemisia tabaci]
MFDDSNNQREEFISVWKSERSVASVGTETDFKVNFKEDSSQTIGSHDQQVQVSDASFSTNQPRYNEENLIAFLRKAGQTVLKVLDEEDPSLKCLSEPITEEADVEFKQICSLEGHVSVLVSSISWSCDEKLIALSYRHHHDNWCHHAGTIHLFKYEESSCQECPAKQPIHTLTLKNCVTSVSFHPNDRTVLAAGTVTGDVYLWSVKKSIVKSEIFSGYHSDCISQISWISNPTDSKLMLASASKDSFIIVWDVSLQSNSIKPKLRFFFEDESHPSVEPGVRCFSFAPLQPDCFVVALMNGNLLKCSIVAARPIPQVKDKKYSMQNAVVSAYKKCSSSPVISIDFQQTKNNMFVAVAADQKCFVYSLTEMEPLRVIISDENIIGASWYQPDTQYFMTWGESVATFYNVKRENFRLNFKPFQSKVDSTLISAVCFNPQMQNRAAFGAESGKTVVWKIPTRVNKDEEALS